MQQHTVNEQLHLLASLLKKSIICYETECNDSIQFDYKVKELIDNANLFSPWFISQHILYSLKNLIKDIEFLSEQPYITISDKNNAQPLLYILNTEAPLEGIAELIYLAVIGIKCYVRTFDEKLRFIQAVADILSEIKSINDNVIVTNQRHKDVKHYVINGHLNTTSAQYLEKYSTLILPPKLSYYVLDREEEGTLFDRIADFTCMNFGRGNNNIRVLFAPVGFDITKVESSFNRYTELLTNNRYFNHWEYRKSVMIVNKIPFTEISPLLITASADMADNVSTLIMKEYETLDEVNDFINQLSSNRGGKLLKKSELTTLSEFQDNLPLLRKFIDDNFVTT